MSPPLVRLVAAVARNGVIGNGGALVWREPEDQRHFRSVTIGHPVVMGRKTWDSLPVRFKPLPERRNIVVTRDPHWYSEGAEAVGSLEAALALAAEAQIVSVIGGAEIYAIALPLADELVLTEIDADLQGDVFFPPWPRSHFAEGSGPVQHARDGTRFRFVTYSRTGDNDV